MFTSSAMQLSTASICVPSTASDSSGFSTLLRRDCDDVNSLPLEDANRVVEDHGQVHEGQVGEQLRRAQQGGVQLLAAQHQRRGLHSVGVVHAHLQRVNPEGEERDGRQPL